MKTISSVVFIVLFAVSTQGAILRVPSEYPSLNAAVTAAQNSDTVLVADGVYTGEENRNIMWSGAEKHLAIASENGPDQCTIDCEGEGIGFFFNDTGQTEADTITGISVINGQSNIGGNVYCIKSSPVFIDCRFVDGRSETSFGMGGAAFCSFSGVRFIQCEFIGNKATKGGGALYMYQCDGQIAQCRFEANETGMSYSYGGTVRLFQSDVLIENSVFTGNVAQSGGGISMHSSSPVILDCRFEDNSAEFGGAFFIDINSNPVIGNDPGRPNIFKNNRGFGGEDLYCSFEPGTPIEAGYNHFSGIFLSGKHVLPQTCFDLHDCQSETVPITADVYVKPDGSDGNDGLSWNTAFQTISHALENILATAEKPITINLAPGTYCTGCTGENFPLIGFSHLHIKGQDPDSIVWDGENVSQLFVCYSGEDVFVQNVDLVNALGEGTGGAMTLMDSDVSLENVNFRNNSAQRGPAIYLRDCNFALQHSQIHQNISDSCTCYALLSTVDIRDTVIHDNIAEYFDGGMYIGGCSGMMRDCIIENNSVSQGSIGGLETNSNEMEFTNLICRGNSSIYYSGGLASNSDASTFKHCEFTNNTSDFGGGLHFSYGSASSFEDVLISGNNASTGGGIAISSSSPVFTNCRIENNTASESGGGVECQNNDAEQDGKPVFDGCMISGNVCGGIGGGGAMQDKSYATLVNTVFYNNTATGAGGGLACKPDSNVAVSNCTFTGNASAEGSAIALDTGYLSMKNTIIWSNSSGTISNTDGELDITYSDMQEAVTGEGNISEDPLFVSLTDFHLQPDSPCIDTVAIGTAPDEDCEGTHRPCGGRSDMGAFEYPDFPADSRIYLNMPDHVFNAGDSFGCTLTVWNADPDPINYPLFVLLQLYGEFYFAPAFSQELSYFQETFPAGESQMILLDEFDLPALEPLSGAAWYAAFTNPSMTELVLNLEIWDFGWK